VPTTLVYFRFFVIKSTITTKHRHVLGDARGRFTRMCFTTVDRCYLDITDSTENRQLGRLIIELYDCVVPKTVLNFLTLCHCPRQHRPGYTGTEFFRINPGLFCLGGDVQYSIGLGGVSSYAQRYFDDENYALSHNAPGITQQSNSPCSVAHLRWM